MSDELSDSAIIARGIVGAIGRSTLREFYISTELLPCLRATIASRLRPYFHQSMDHVANNNRKIVSLFREVINTNLRTGPTRHSRQRNFHARENRVTEVMEVKFNNSYKLVLVEMRCYSHATRKLVECIRITCVKIIFTF